MSLISILLKLPCHAHLRCLGDRLAEGRKEIATNWSNDREQNRMGTITTPRKINNLEMLIAFGTQARPLVKSQREPNVGIGGCASGI
ncbi:hypothetical protein [Bradyrhizobium sp. DASA03007]|uniref:hypothetical protein n=1 Tax=unclassified Bradyrhizobium TaxID=2631580 RepID=UPI003F7277B6